MLLHTTDNKSVSHENYMCAVCIFSFSHCFKPRVRVRGELISNHKLRLFVSVGEGERECVSII